MTYNILFSVAALIVFYMGSRLFKRLLNNFARRKEIKEKRVFYIGKVFDVLFMLTFLLTLAFIWSVDIKVI